MINGFAPAALSQLAGALGGRGASVIFDFTAVVDAVDRLRATAESIDYAVRNPSWTAGDEMCRRAGKALSNGWTDDALRDSQASIDAYPYRALPHLLAALAHLDEGDAVNAYASLESAIKYGPEEPRETVTAALIACQMADGAGAPKHSLVLLRRAARHVPDAPHLIFARIARGDNHDLRADALQMFWRTPEMSFRLATDPGLFEPICVEASRAVDIAIDWLDGNMSGLRAVLGEISRCGQASAAHIASITSTMREQDRWRRNWEILDSVEQSAAARPTLRALRDEASRKGNVLEMVQLADRVSRMAAAVYAEAAETRKRLTLLIAYSEREAFEYERPVAAAATLVNRMKAQRKYGPVRKQLSEAYRAVLSETTRLQTAVTVGAAPEGQWLLRRNQLAAGTVVHPLVDLPTVSTHLAA